MKYASILSWLMGLAVTFHPELSFAEQATPVEGPDVVYHYGWSCATHAGAVQNLRAQVNVIPAHDRVPSEYQIRVISVPKSPEGSPVLITAVDHAMQRVESNRIIYLGSNQGEAAELRIHSDLKDGSGYASHLILERSRVSLTSMIPILSVIKMDCFETRLPATE